MIPPGARVWIAMGHTDMRKGMQGLALMVQQSLKCDPHGGDLFVFRGRVIVGHRPAAPLLQRQSRLCAIERLDLTFLVD